MEDTEPTTPCPPPSRPVTPTHRADRAADAEVESVMQSCTESDESVTPPLSDRAVDLLQTPSPRARRLLLSARSREQRSPPPQSPPCCAGSVFRALHAIRDLVCCYTCCVGRRDAAARRRAYLDWQLRPCPPTTPCREIETPSPFSSPRAITEKTMARDTLCARCRRPARGVCSECHTASYCSSQCAAENYAFHVETCARTQVTERLRIADQALANIGR